MTKRQARARRHKRVRRKVSGTAERPRLCVFRSSRHIYAQVIDDVSGRTVCAASSLSREVREVGATGAGKEAARLVGKLMAERAVAAKVKKVVFDRGGYDYHGRVKELAEGAREAGLEF